MSHQNSSRNCRKFYEPLHDRRYDGVALRLLSSVVKYIVPSSAHALSQRILAGQKTVLLFSRPLIPPFHSAEQRTSGDSDVDGTICIPILHVADPPTLISSQIWRKHPASIKYRSRSPIIVSDVT